MRRSPRVLLAWSATVVVALTTARVVGGDLATLHQRAASLGPRHSVVVADHDLEIGEAITAHDVHAETRYASEIPRDALSDPRRAVGRIVVVPLLRDAIVFAHHVAPADRTGLDGVIPVGDRAVHVGPKDGFRPPLGAIVDVLAAFDPTVVQVQGAGTAAVVVASAARVLAVDDGTDGGIRDSANAGVTLLVTDTEARAIAFAAASADLTLAIAPPESACCARSAP
jgi:Flp pilus assembly protein CpaB